MSVKIPDMAREGHVLMAVVPVQQRSVQGTKSYTIYNFNPWSLVEERDVADFQQASVTLGCACNGDQRTVPWFATADQIRSGSVIPEWAKP